MSSPPQTRQITLIVNDLPYVNEKAWNALRLANALVKGGGVKVRIFLLSDAVYLAKAGHQPPEGHPNLEEMLTRLIKEEVEVGVCTTCVKARSSNPLPEELEACFVADTKGEVIEPYLLVEGAEMMGMVNLAEWVKTSDRTISF